jgi:ABC-type multidrug transport system ATPase subunit
MLRIDGVSKTYASGVRAVRDVSLEIPPGVFGLLGPNGAGKTTLLRAVATLLEPDQGEIHFGTIDVRREPHALRRVLGYLPQDFGVYPRSTARDFLEYLALMKGFTHKSERRDEVDHLLHLANLWEVRKRPLGTFSGGMRQRFGIAQALIGDPRLVIVDEPTAGLDPEERNRFLGLLSEIGPEVVVVLSTHIVDDVADVCQGMAILVEGRIRRGGDPRAALDELAGSVWRKAVTRDELAALRQSHDVLGTRWHSGRLVVHVLSAERPPDGFEPVAPDLSDFYFHTVRHEPPAA